MENVFRIFAGALLVSMITFAHAESQEQLETTREIARSGMSVAFPKGSLKNCETFDLVNGQEIQCALGPSATSGGKWQMTVRFLLEQGGGQIVGIEGVIDLVTPIPIRFSSMGEHTRPFLQLPENALKGLQLYATKFSVGGPFGSSMRMAAPGPLIIVEHTLLHDTKKGSTGRLVLSGSGFNLIGVRTALPGTADAHAVTLSAAKVSTVRFDLATERVQIVEGAFSTATPLVFDTFQTLSAHGLDLPIGAKPPSASLKVSVIAGRATAAVADLRPITDKASYKGSVVLLASGVKGARLGSIESEVMQTEPGLKLQAKSAKISRVSVPGQLAMSSADGESPFLAGTGAVLLETLSPTGLAGKLDLTEVTQSPTFGSAVGGRAMAISASFDQPASKPLSAKGAAKVSELTFGTVAFKNLSAPIQFATGSNGDVTLTTGVIHTVARISDVLPNAAATPKPMIEGAATIEKFRGQVFHAASGQRQLRILKDDLQFRFDKPVVNVRLAGGLLSVGNKKLSFSNGELVASAEEGLRGTFQSMPTPMTAPAMNSILVPGRPSIRIGTVTLSAVNAYFTVDPQLAAASPFGLTGSFVVKGIGAHFDPPTQLRANDIEIRTSDVFIDSLTVSANLAKAKVSIEGFKLTADEFRMVSKEGKTEAPSMTGNLNAPFSIPLAEVDIPYADAVELFNLNVRDIELNLKDVKYVDAAKSTVTLPTVKFAVPELTDDRIVASFETTDGNYAANMDTKDFTGTVSAALKKIRLDIDGPRKPMKGFIEIALASMSTHGKIPWKPVNDFGGELAEAKVANPDFSIKLNVDADIPELSGRFNFNGDDVDGELKAHAPSHIWASYLGPKVEVRWEHDWRLQDEKRWRTEYPCGGTFLEPVRNCEAWGILLPQIDAKLRWHLVIAGIVLDGNVTDFRLIPKKAEKDYPCTLDPVLCPGGTVKKKVATGIKQCKGMLVPPVAFIPAWSLYPDLINDGGDVGRLFNDAFGVIIGKAESEIAAAAVAAGAFFAHDWEVFGSCNQD